MSRLFIKKEKKRRRRRTFHRVLEFEYCINKQAALNPLLLLLQILSYSQIPSLALQQMTTHKQNQSLY